MSYGTTGYPGGPVVYGSYQSAPQPPARPKPGPGLGVTGFILSFVACIGHFVLAHVSADWFLALQRVSSSSSQAEELGYKAVGTGIGQAALGVLNLVGIILNIVALATGRGRVLGLIGLLIGVLAPVGAFFWFGSQAGLL